MKRLVRRVAGQQLDSASPLLSRLLSARGIAQMSDVNPGLAALAVPDAMMGLSGAADLVAEAINDRKKILIIGDFDADGATSCALLVLGLRSMGCTLVDYLVPNRFEFGYGLTPEIVDVAMTRSPHLLITVDNGISSVEGVAHANSLGLKVVITDHHLPGDTLPAAAAIINPNQPGCAFPSKCLAGVGVAFYLLTAVRSRLRAQGWFAKRATTEPNLADYLDLVALGTIADVVPLDRNNRILVSEGLRRLNAGVGRPGLLALIRQSGARANRITTRDLAFGVAPRLNAAGRLDDMSLGIECLLTHDGLAAEQLARRLDELNIERRRIEGEMKEQALDAGRNISVESGASSGWISDRNAVGVCLFHEDFHQGVVGIVAARVKDKVHRPVIAFARGGENELKGSARSIPGLHIRDALDAIAARNPGLVVKFGGHAMAAGLTLAPENLQTFARAFDDEAKRWLDKDALEQVIHSDGEMGEPFTVTTARQILESAPWGQGFPEPVFDDEFEILSQRIVGERHLRLKLRPARGSEAIDAIAFNHGHHLVEGRIRRIAYRIDINFYQGIESVQLIVEALELTSA